jgi:hypothetical protein
MATLKEIPALDTAVEPSQNSWTSLPAGFLLVIEEGTPDYYLLIDDEDHRLLVE